MFSKKDKKVTNIKQKSVSKMFKDRKNNNLKISIIDAKYGEYEGEEILIDEPIINCMLDGIYKSVSQSISKYNTMPKSIIISHEEDLTNSDNKDILCQKNKIEKANDEIIDIYNPKYDFENVYIKEEAKNQILGGLTIIKNKSKLFDEWGLSSSIKTNRALVFNFYGPPGTGKSMTAEAIASYLNKQVFSVNYSQLESKYVGETPKNIKRIFEKASKEDAVLILDEADSFLGKRLTNITQSSDYGVNITRSVMLLELEKFDGVVIFTTNLLDNYDEAFKRRILANIEFNLPDVKGREKIWQTHIPKQFPLSEHITPVILAEKYEDISGADIKDIILFAGVNAIQDKREIVIEEDFDLAYKYIKNRYNSGQSSFKNIEVKTTRITEDEYKKEIERESV